MVNADVGAPAPNEPAHGRSNVTGKRVELVPSARVRMPSIMLVLPLDIFCCNCNFNVCCKAYAINSTRLAGMSSSQRQQYFAQFNKTLINASYPYYQYGILQSRLVCSLTQLFIRHTQNNLWGRCPHSQYDYIFLVPKNVRRQSRTHHYHHQQHRNRHHHTIITHSLKNENKARKALTEIRWQWNLKKVKKTFVVRTWFEW